MTESKIIRTENFTWKGVERKEYKAKSTLFKDVHRYSLLGEEIPELNFHTRYFEVLPGGYSSLEHHRHPHSVVVIRGSGSVILNDSIDRIGLHDVIYVAPGTIHQFLADNNEPLGFLCIADRYRDKPVIPDDEKIKQVIRSEKVLQKMKR